MRSFQGVKRIMRWHVDVIMCLKNFSNEITLFLDFRAGDDVRTDVAVDFARQQTRPIGHQAKVSSGTTEILQA